MTDVATLGLAVDSREVVDASKDLDRIREAAARAEKQADSFGARVEAAGRRAAAANDNSAKAADRASRAYEGYSKAAMLAARAIGAIAGAAIGTALIRYGDQWSDMQSRVGAAIKDMDAAPALMQRIVDIANASYSPLSQTVEIYGRNVAVLRDLGRGAVEAADFTEALNHALVTTATKGQDADVVLNALSRAIATGKLRAMEFETIMSRSPRVLEAIADELGTNVNGLLAMAKAGKVTGDVIVNALINNLEKLRAEAAEMPATIGDAFVRIQTNLIAFVGQLDKTVGASETVAGALLTLADNIGRVVTYAATAVTAFGTYYVAAMVAAYVSTMTLNGALVLLRAALIRTGIGALIIGAGELVYQFGRLVSAAGGFGEAMGLVGDLVAEVWGRIKIGGQALAMELTAVAQRIKASFLDAWGAIAGAFGQMMEAIGSGYNAIASKLPGFMGDWTWDASGVSEYAKEVQRAADFTHQLSDNSRAAAEKLYGDAQASLESIAAIRKVLADAASGEIPNTPGVRSLGTPDVDKAAEKAKKAYDQIVDSAQEYIAAQRLEAEVLGLSEQAANALRYEQDLLNDARRAGITLTDADKAGFRALAEAMAEAEERTRFLTEAFDFTKDTIKGFFTDLRKGLSEGKTFWESFADAGVAALNKIADKLIEMALDQMINNFLRNLMQAFNFGGFSFGNTSYFPPAPSGGFHTLAGGGFVSGPGTATSDSIPAWLSDGEFVVRAAAVAQPGVLPLLEAINTGDFAVRMAMGGLARMHAPANTGVQRFAHGGLAQSRPGAQSNAAPSVTVNVQNNTSAQVEVGEPQQNADGSLTIDLIVNELEGKMEASMRGGRLGRAAQQTFGLQRRVR